MQNKCMWACGVDDPQIFKSGQLVASGGPGDLKIRLKERYFVCKRLNRFCGINAAPSIIKISNNSCQHSCQPAPTCLTHTASHRPLSKLQPCFNFLSKGVAFIKLNPSSTSTAHFECSVFYCATFLVFKRDNVSAELID